VDLPTYTSIWRIEKRLYKLYDFRLPMPVPVGQIAVFAAITVPYVILLTVLGLPFNHTLFWLYVLPPGVITWLATRPVLESKRLPELIISQVRYLGEPATWCRMSPLAEKDDIVLIGRVWRRAEVPDQIPAPAPAAAPATAPARRPAPAPAGTAAAAKRLSAAPVRAGAQRIPVAQSGAIARPAAFGQATPAGPAPARPQAAPGTRAGGARLQARLPESVRAARQVWETPRNPAAAAAAASAALPAPAPPVVPAPPGGQPVARPPEIAHDDQRAQARPGAAPHVPTRPAWPTGNAAAGPTEAGLAPPESKPAVPPSAPPAPADAGQASTPGEGRPPTLPPRWPVPAARTADPQPGRFGPPPGQAGPAQQQRTPDEPIPAESGSAAGGPEAAAPAPAPADQSESTTAKAAPAAAEAAPASLAPSQPEPASAGFGSAPGGAAPAADADPAADTARTADTAQGVDGPPSVDAAPAADSAPSVDAAPADTTAAHTAPGPATPAPEGVTPAHAAPAGLAQNPAPHVPPIVVVGGGSARPAMVERALGGPGQHRTVTSWREHVRVVPGGHGPGRPDMEQRDRARVQQPIPGPRLIAVLGCTVGAGQSVTTLMLSDVLASLRGEPVAALDLNPGPTCLSGLARTAPAATVRGLLAGSPPTAPAPRRGRLDLIAHDAEAPGEGLSDPDYARLLRIITDRYMLTLADPGASAVARLLSVADQLVLVAPASAEASRAVAMTMEWLDGHGFAELCAGSVAVINGVSKRSMSHVEQAELIVRGRCRVTVRVPWDERLAAARTTPGSSPGNGRSAQGPESRFSQLRPQAQLAYTALAGVLVSALAADPPAAAGQPAAAGLPATPAPGNGEQRRASQ
jgi:MinD-like ATPase involved in chromosome partitioning or flagellar assembly